MRFLSLYTYIIQGIFHDNLLLFREAESAPDAVVPAENGEAENGEKKKKKKKSK